MSDSLCRSRASQVPFQPDETVQRAQMVSLTGVGACVTPTTDIRLLPFHLSFATPSTPLFCLEGGVQCSGECMLIVQRNCSRFSPLTSLLRPALPRRLKESRSSFQHLRSSRSTLLPSCSPTLPTSSCMCCSAYLLDKESPTDLFPSLRDASQLLPLWL